MIDEDFLFTVPENPAKCKDKLRMKRCARKKANKKCWKSWVKWACPFTCKVCCGNRWIEKKCAKYRHHCATSKSIRKHCRKDCGICTNQLAFENKKRNKKKMQTHDQNSCFSKVYFRFFFSLTTKQHAKISIIEINSKEFFI